MNIVDSETRKTTKEVLLVMASLKVDMILVEVGVEVSEAHPVWRLRYWGQGHCENVIIGFGLLRTNVQILVFRGDMRSVNLKIGASQMGEEWWSNVEVGRELDASGCCVSHRPTKICPTNKVLLLKFVNERL